MNLKINKMKTASRHYMAKLHTKDKSFSVSQRKNTSYPQMNDNYIDSGFLKSESLKRIK